MTEESKSDDDGGVNVSGRSGINAGGNVSFGDLSGQVAIGENITQTQTLTASDKNESGIKDKHIPQLFKKKEYGKIEGYIVDELQMCETLFHRLVNEYPDIFDGRI